jgi:hypothetical protein
MSATTDINSSSFHEVKVCALNEQQNVDLTTERENRKQETKSRGRK